MRTSAAFLLVLAACGESPTEVPRPPDAEPFTPPAIYESYYERMAGCAGLEGDFGRVTWFVVPGVLTWESTYNGVSVPAEWWPPHDIYIAGRRTGGPGTQELIEHESLHDLAQTPDHPTPPFGDCSPVTL